MRKLIIGITGTFGSGKTTVTKMLKRRNAFVIDADRLAKKIAGQKEIKQQLINSFGTAEPRKLARIVFSDAGRLAKLNKTIHPLVKKEAKKIIARAKRKIIAIDAALLVEARFLDLLDCLVLIRCDDKTRMKRLLKKGFGRHEIRERTSHQLPDSRKKKYADFVIDNSGSLKETKAQVDKIWKNITGK